MYDFMMRFDLDVNQQSLINAGFILSETEGGNYAV